MAIAFFKSVVMLLIFLIGADILGVVVCTILDVAPLRYGSAMLPYAIWFVLGIFTGLIAFHVAGSWASPRTEQDWSALPGAARIGNCVAFAVATLLVGLSAFFNHIYWSRNIAGEYFVPDSASHSIVFFGAVFSAMLLGRSMLVRSAGPPSVPEA